MPVTVPCPATVSRTATLPVPCVGTPPDPASDGFAMATLPLREAREVFEREYLLTQINRFGGNISRTAGFVGMERSALHRKLKSLGVVGGAKPGDRDGADDDEDGEGAP